MVIAEELAREFRARLVLLGRTPLVPAREWNHALESSDTPLRLKSRIKKLVELQSLGAEILYLVCDVSHRDEIKRAIEVAEQSPFNFLVQHVGVGGEYATGQKLEAAMT